MHEKRAENMLNSKRDEVSFLLCTDGLFSLIHSLLTSRILGKDSDWRHDFNVGVGAFSGYLERLRTESNTAYDPKSVSSLLRAICNFLQHHSQVIGKTLAFSIFVYIYFFSLVKIICGFFFFFPLSFLWFVVLQNCV
jgi:hypothetical protein